MKYRFLHNFVAKNLCDKISKIKNLRWQFRSIFRWLCVFNFFCRPCFYGEIYETKWTFFQPFASTRRNILKSDHFVLQISPWKQGLQKKLNTPRQSQQKILLNCHLRFFIFEILSQRFLATKLCKNRYFINKLV